MTIDVRNARSADRERCLELLAILRAGSGGTVPANATKMFDVLLERERGEIHVADEEGAVLGFAAVTYNPAMRYGGEYCQLEELVVDPEARGKKLGVLLMETVLAAARARDCAECGLYLIPTTAHNRPFYERFGFEALDVEMRMRL